MECSKLMSVVALICLSIPMVASSSLGESGFRVNLTRRTEGAFNSTEGLRSAVDRSKKRVNAIEAFVKQQITGAQLDAEIPVQAGTGEFLMSIAVGTPPVSFEAIVDTGSDLVWTKCEPCQDCSQSTPIFDPSKSSSYSTVSCTDSLCDALGTSKTGCNPDCAFTYSYFDGSQIIGDLAKETLSIGSTSDGVFAGIVFGCSHDNQGSISRYSGLVGLGRRDLSLISQLGSEVNNKFSYCLVSRTDSASQTSPLIFGDSASLNGAKTISFITNSATSHWYIPLIGITVNGNAIDIPAGTFDLGSDGSGGMMIDSGTTLTYLVQAAYDPVKEAIQSAITLTPTDGSSVGLDLCYQTSSDVTLPTVVFNFEGGVDYELPGDNLFVQESGLLCLAMAGSSEISIFGNVQQQNFHILYDNAQNTLSFMPAKCDSL